MLAQRVSSPQQSIFAEMTALANKYNAVNLGQGFPNMPCPSFLKDLAKEGLTKDQNQYTHSFGLPILRENLANFYSPFFRRELDLNKEILVTVGATEAIFATCQAFLDEGDEVILFEPFYDSYPSSIKMAGGKPVYVPMQTQSDGSWKFDLETLKDAFNKKTKLIFINTPHNPIGKIFSNEELQQIANLCKEHQVLAVCDEVYEFMIFEDAVHNRMANIPGMWENTITISSAGKTFGATGFKIGWIVANSTWIDAIHRARQWISFCVATPLQYAVAKSIEVAQQQNYFQALSNEYQKLRDILCDNLTASGLKVSIPKGTYFVMADHSTFDFEDDVSFCHYLTKEIGVTAIPPSFFYGEEHRSQAKNFARFCFCKDEETIKEAGKRLQKLKK